MLYKLSILLVLVAVVVGVCCRHDYSKVHEAYQCYVNINDAITDMPISPELKTKIITDECGINEEGMVEGWYNWYVYDSFDGEGK